MAVMNAADREVARKRFLEEIANIPAGVEKQLGITKAELVAAVNATDQWISDNAAAFNLALPQPARGALTAAQKTKIFCFVAWQRYVAGV